MRYCAHCLRPRDGPLQHRRRHRQDLVRQSIVHLQERLSVGRRPREGRRDEHDGAEQDARVDSGRNGVAGGRVEGVVVVFEPARQVPNLEDAVGFQGGLRGERRPLCLRLLH